MAATLCVHGQLKAKSDQCQCDRYWQGIDCSVRKCLGGLLNSTTSECRCTTEYGGEFCHVHICSQEGRWYCDEADGNKAEFCTESLLNQWIPQQNAADWNCSCGHGTRILLENATYSSCLCEEGYYGNFCQWKLCENGPPEKLWNGPCAINSQDFGVSASANETETGRGIFGFGFSSDLLLALLLMTTFLVVVLAVTRLCARKVRSRRARSEERIGIEQFQAWRSARNRLPDGMEGGKRAADGYNNAPKEIDNTRLNNRTPAYVDSFHDIFWWRGANGMQNHNKNVFQRLPIVLEENSDVDEGDAGSP